MSDEEIGRADAALAAGRWAEAKQALTTALQREDRADARFGLAVACWWLGDNRDSVTHATRAYALLRRAGDREAAVRCAIWLAITYKANFDNPVAANGWLTRAQRLLEPLDPGPLHGWVRVARAYRMADLDRAVALSEEALDVARAAGDVDLELVALSQVGLGRVGRGEIAAGFALIDEAITAALAGEGGTLDTVVYVCCDMLTACELAADLDRAAQWCRVADDFIATYGCPFLYAECRILYGSLLATRGRWPEAERELDAGLRITLDACPGLHGRGLVRLAALRIRQGRLEEADQLVARIGDGGDAGQEAVLAAAALALARGDATAAADALRVRLRHLGRHRSRLAAALDLLVDAHLAAGDTAAAVVAAQRLSEVAAATDSAELAAVAGAARGRVARARGDLDDAVHRLLAAQATWDRLEMPYEAARTRLELAAAVDEPTLAVEHARRALTAFDTLGAVLDADRAAAFLRARGVVARTGAKRGGELTDRERAVLALLGAGLSNPEIAARLHISRKTAAHHVSNILTKLDLRNRAAAAAYATASGATASR
jgi:DNA-binding CsgD family transcriptional regulator